MKTIITQDKANIPYGFPQLDGSGKVEQTHIPSNIIITSVTSTNVVADTIFGNSITGGTFYGDGSNLTNVPPTPAGGLDTQIQFNNNGTFDGNEGLKYNTNLNAFAQGDGLTISGSPSHAQGIDTAAIGDGSHSEGYGTIALGDMSHAEGSGGQGPNISIGYASHVEGTMSTSGSFGYYTNSVTALTDGGIIMLPDYYGDITGQFYVPVIIFDDTQYNDLLGTVIANVSGVTFDGTNTFIYHSNPNIDSLEGNIFTLFNVNPLNSDQSIGDGSHAEGLNTKTYGNFSHTEGSGTISIGRYSHAEGNETQTLGQYSHSEGIHTISQGSGSHAEGYGTISYGQYSHSEGQYSYSVGDNSHAEGSYNVTGYRTQLIDQFTDSDGYITFTGITSNEYQLYFQTGLTIFVLNDSFGYTHSSIISESTDNLDGSYTIKIADWIIGYVGYFVSAINSHNSHSEGFATMAYGEYSHSEGLFTAAKGDGSHAEGYGTIAEHDYQNVVGKFNTVGETSDDTLFVIGNGTSNEDRSDIVTVNSTGMTVNGDVSAQTFNGIRKYVALLTQNFDGGDIQQQNTGTLVIGRTYRIIVEQLDSPGYDFTNVGAPMNDNGVWFVATGEVPNSWGSEEGNTDILEYDLGAPTVTVLENTLGNVYWRHNTNGSYFGDLSFLNPIDASTIQNYTTVITGSQFIDNAGFNGYVRYSYVDTSGRVNIGTFDYDNNLPSDQILCLTPIEIRVYP